MSEQEFDLVVVVGEGGQEVVDKDLDPFAESPKPEAEDSRMVIVVSVILLILMLRHHSLPHFFAASQNGASSHKPAIT